MKESLDSGRECTAASVSRVITFGLSGEQNTRVGEALPAKGCELFATDAPTDLIAVSAAALIIDSAALDEESRNMLFDYYTEIGSCSDETVFWLGSPGPPGHLLTRFKCYENFDAFAADLKYHLLSAHRRSNKARTFSTRLGKCLQIMQKIKEKPGIRTQVLAAEIGISEKTTQRYIAALQYAGEWIEYDEKKKGWYLQNGRSPYFE